MVNLAGLANCLSDLLCIPSADFLNLKKCWSAHQADICGRKEFGAPLTHNYIAGYTALAAVQLDAQHLWQRAAPVLCRATLLLRSPAQESQSSEAASSRTASTVLAYYCSLCRLSLCIQARKAHTTARCERVPPYLLQIIVWSAGARAGPCRCK